MNSGIRSFTAYQKRVLGACFAVYFCTYIGRLNMSATLDDIIGSFKGLDNATGGLLQTLFAVFYAMGQLLFGFLADKFEPKRLIMTGLIGSAMANLAFSFMPSFGLLLAMWTVNGVFQSMIWTPIVICMAHCFEDKKRKSASFVMSFTLALGHFAAWGLAMLLSRQFSWRWSYRIPALILLLASFAALFMLPGGLRGSSKGKKNAITAQPVKTLLGTGLILMLFCCVLNGFVRDGVVTWAPTILGGKQHTMLFSLIIPCVNLLGIMLGAYLVRHYRGNIRALTGLMTGFSGIPALLACALGNMHVAVAAVLLGLMSAVLYGTNPLLTTLTPLEYDAFGRVGLVAGLIDCSIYLGSALSGTFTGLVSQSAQGWRAVYGLWTAAAFVSCMMALLAARKGRELKRRAQSL